MLLAWHIAGLACCWLGMLLAWHVAGLACCWLGMFGDVSKYGANFGLTPQIWLWNFKT